MADVPDALKLEESLKNISLEGIILLQGLLAQRALQIMHEPKQESKILKPKKIL